MTPTMRATAQLRGTAAATTLNTTLWEIHFIPGCYSMRSKHTLLSGAGPHAAIGSANHYYKPRAIVA